MLKLIKKMTQFKSASQEKLPFLQYINEHKEKLEAGISLIFFSQTLPVKPFLHIHFGVFLLIDTHSASNINVLIKSYID